MCRVAVVVLALVAWLAPSPAEAATYGRRIVAAVNQTRADHAAPPVRFGPCVDRYAEQWARHLAATGQLVHRDQYVIAKACNGRMVGEVIAAGAIRPRTVIGLWLRSPAHRRVILRPSYRRIGVGAIHTGDRWIVVANLIRH